MKLKVPKLDWKQKIEKLRKIVLSSVAIENVPPDMIAVFETWRALTHEKITEAEYTQKMQAMQGSFSAEQLIWEPYSDERGEVEALYGWQIQATVFGINSQPYWFVRARFEKAFDPTDQQRQILEKAIELLGCHDVELDLIIEFTDDDGHWVLYWHWFHTGPLLEIHFQKGLPMLVVNEGTPLKDGYTRMPRLSRKDPDHVAEGDA